MTASASAAGGASAAASQSTVLVTVGNTGGTGNGFSSGSFGSVSPAAVLGKSINEIYSDNLNSVTIRFLHGGTPLTKSFFRAVTIKKASGSVTLNTADATTFVANSGGNSSFWVWTGTAALVAGDAGQARTVAFFR